MNPMRWHHPGFADVTAVVSPLRDPHISFSKPPTHIPELGSKLLAQDAPGFSEIHHV